MLLNPYIAGNPISGEHGFFGRQDVVREVMQVLHHSQSNAIVLYGQRRMGALPKRGRLVISVILYRARRYSNHQPTFEGQKPRNPTIGPLLSDNANIRDVHQLVLSKRYQLL